MDHIYYRTYFLVSTFNDGKLSIPRLEMSQKHKMGKIQSIYSLSK